MTKIFLSIILLCTLVGCSAQDKNSIYYEGREFTYTVEIIQDSTVVKNHKIKLKVTNNLWAKMMTGGQTGIEWIYETVIDSTTGEPLSVPTGVIDNPKRVFLHPPRDAFMKFTEIAPMPDINLPTEIGTTSETTLEVVMGFGDLDGKKIKQSTKIADRKNVALYGKTYKNVWIIKGKNTNYLKELGQYKVTYWFDGDFGFIRMKYEKPNGEIVDLKLKNVKD